MFALKAGMGPAVVSTMPARSCASVKPALGILVPEQSPFEVPDLAMEIPTCPMDGAF